MTTTTTKPLFTRKQLIALLLPLIAEQALSVTIGLADTLMVSSVGEAAVSGVSLVDSFNVLLPCARKSAAPALYTPMKG
jgi:Na+-driven multidrug efflux pump